jgi:hypothetical protein
MNCSLRIAAALLLPLLLAACPDAPKLNGAAVAPDTVGPASVQRLDRMKDMADLGNWEGIRATVVPICSRTRDAVCGSAHALRAQACRKLATLGAADRGALLDCAVAEGNAALGAGEATPQAQRSNWRQGLAWSLFDRRQDTARPAQCPDNAALRTQADLLRGEQPALADARFLAASARLTGAESCGTVPACAELAEAAGLLSPAPAGADPKWDSLVTAVRLERTRQGCGGGR